MEKVKIELINTLIGFVIGWICCWASNKMQDKKIKKHEHEINVLFDYITILKDQLNQYRNEDTTKNLNNGRDKS